MFIEGINAVMLEIYDIYYTVEINLNFLDIIATLFKSCRYENYPINFCHYKFVRPIYLYIVEETEVALRNVIGYPIIPHYIWCFARFGTICTI